MLLRTSKKVITHWKTIWDSWIS